MPSLLPFGCWPSRLSAAAVAAAARRLSQPRLHRGRVYWLESRPEDGGRQGVVRLEPGGGAVPVTPSGMDVRSRVHEYGGGDFGFVGDTLVYAASGEPGIQRLGAAPLGGSRSGARYADFCGSPDGKWLVAVEEAPRGEEEPENRLVAFHLPSGERRILLGDHDFVSSPCFARDGSRLACLACTTRTCLGMAPSFTRFSGTPPAP